MQIHKLLRACGGRFLRAQQKYRCGVVTQAEFWATGLELFSPHYGDSIYRKAYPTRISPLITCPAITAITVTRPASGSRLLVQVETTTNRRPPLNLSKPVGLYR
ncbi:hypothetical protein Zmor_024367 [Zophobas morio]|uniref:Uncharacterized protein n=1 Tax=Zophobas morio TaxID=2755281 RepID=A0AA38HYQ4_9CUCU|nr:hypothetical protein Zmor_024367 [Zophobas morio]